MKVGMAFERKNFEYKVVAKVPHETEKDIFVYLIVQREFGSNKVEYFTQEWETEIDGKAFKETTWIGVG